MTALRFLIFGAAVMLWSGAALAAPQPVYHQVKHLGEAEKATSVRYGYGCGVDYPCPPRPYHRPRAYYRGGAGTGVYIGRNYGTVNIRISGQRPVHRVPRYRYSSYRYPSVCDDNRCSRNDWRRRGYPDPVPAAMPDEVAEDGATPPTGCGGYPCDQNCGPSCWYDRFKTGYCGHGCDTYRSKVRFETEDRTIKAPKIIIETRPRPPGRDEAFADPDRSSEFDRRRDFDEKRDLDRSRGQDRRRDVDEPREAGERASRERYQGPAYPVQ